MVWFIIIVLGVIAAIVSIWILTLDSDSKKGESEDTKANDSTSSHKSTSKDEIYQQNHKAVQSWLEKRIESYNKWLEYISNKYGKYDHIIKIEPHESMRTLLIYESKRFIYYNGCISFDSILDYKIRDIGKVIPGSTTIVTETNKWDEYHRENAIRSFGQTMGTMMSRPVRQTSSVITTPDKVNHYYVVELLISDFSNPSVEIKVGSDQQILNRIVNIIEIILHNRKQSE